MSHIPRLMVLGNYALQRGIHLSAMTDWFHESFVGGYEWVMVANVVGMSQHADGGVLATKPYASGGAYIDRRSDYCRDCRYDPRKRLGDDACPYTAGYWAFLDRTRGRLAGITVCAGRCRASTGSRTSRLWSSRSSTAARSRPSQGTTAPPRQPPRGGGAEDPS